MVCRSLAQMSPSKVVLVRFPSDASDRFSSYLVGANKHVKETDVDLAAHVVDKDKACGDCYGAQTPEQPCCNTCKEVRIE